MNRVLCLAGDVPLDGWTDTVMHTIQEGKIVMQQGKITVQQGKIIMQQGKIAVQQDNITMQ